MKQKNMNDNLKFEKTQIQFFPEDIEKMETMTLAEQVEFKHMLKSRHRYVVKK